MHIPSDRTRRDMDAVAELRVAGATWDDIGQLLGRQEFVLRRWTYVYREDWERLLRAAEQRAGRRDEPDRATLRALLRHESPRVRRQTAEELLRQREAERATESPFQERADLATFLAVVQQMGDDELNGWLSEFITKSRRDSAEETEP